MTSSFPANSSLGPSELHCPLLQTMISHRLNNDNQVNMAAVIVHGVVAALGILENGLVLWVLGWRLRRKTVASVWVLNLALSDFLTTLTLPLFTYYLLNGHSWELGGPLCAAQASIFFLNMFVSAFLLAAISLDRCLLVTKPVWTQNQRTVSMAWKTCGLGWIWAAFNTFPYFMFRSVVVKQDGRKLCYHDFALYSSPNTLNIDCKVRQTATAVSKVLLAFVVPLVVIAVSYASFVLELQARRKRLESRLKVARNDKQTSSKFLISPSIGQNGTRLSQSFTKMIFSVIATFVLCWVPYHVFCLLEVTAQYKTEFVDVVEEYLPFVTTFSFLNSVLNPIIYTFSCPDFCTRIRQSLGTLFEGLVEEAGPGRRRKSDLSSPIFLLRSPTTPRTHCAQLKSKGSFDPFAFKSHSIYEGTKNGKI
ncbi:prostaglandin D2 receptor 2 [Danio aesculapii]|uniref:prostaglandin D2 receptor 2 n=1 Tax=Danio aesculapii TaxID=1142201 RepID=UPI0024BF6715|nr:prostaglandin D2 receptor 2 [Danio aesculapii]